MVLNLYCIFYREELKAIKSKLSNKGKSKTTKTENVQNDTELAEDNYFERQRNKEKNHKLYKLRIFHKI